MELNLKDTFKKIQNAIDKIQENPLYNETAETALSFVPLVGSTLVRYWQKYKQSKEAGSDILDTLKIMQKLNDENKYKDFCNQLEQKADRMLEKQDELKIFVGEQSRLILDKINIVQDKVEGLDDKMNLLLHALSHADNPLAFQMIRYMKNEPEPEQEIPHDVILRREGNILKFENTSRPDLPVAIITEEHMKKLDDNNEILLQIYDDSLQNQYNTWRKIYPIWKNSFDPNVKYKIEKKLNETAERMCHDLTNVLDLVLDMDVSLYDHYEKIYDICNQRYPNF